MHEAFNARIEGLDLDLFHTIHSQSTDDDRIAWLAIQRNVRRRAEGYVYLEIGSHLGGSLQQHLADHQCRRIYSIDPRPTEQPDERGQVYRYHGNSTKRMLANLSAVTGSRLDRLTCFDCDVSGIDRSWIQDAPDFCFIDGEHTAPAVLADFEFCLYWCRQDGVIVFHDDSVILAAIRKILTSLKSRGIRFTARKCGGSTFAVFLGDSQVIAESSDGLRWAADRSIAVSLQRNIPEWALPVARHLYRFYRSLLGGVPVLSSGR